MTFPKIAGWGWYWWYLRLGLGNSCALWLATHCGVTLPVKLCVTEVMSLCLLHGCSETTALYGFGGLAVRTGPMADTIDWKPRGYGIENIVIIALVLVVVTIVIIVTIGTISNSNKNYNTNANRNNDNGSNRYREKRVVALA